MKFTNAYVDIFFGLSSSTLAAPATARDFMPTVTYTGINASDYVSQNVDIQEVFIVGESTGYCPRGEL